MKMDIRGNHDFSEEGKGSDCFEDHVDIAIRSYLRILNLVSARGRARSFMEKLRFSYAAHISSSSLCSTSTGWNPLSSSPWNSVS